jgi:hypothetical protein
VKASREAPHCEIFGTEAIKGHTVGVHFFNFHGQVLTFAGCVDVFH